MRGAWASVRAGLAQRLRWPARLQDNRSRYVAQVLMIGCAAVFLSQLSMSHQAVRQMSLVLCALLLGLLWALVRGLSVNAVVLIGTGLSTLYLGLSSLVEGGVYSSTLVWLPLLALAVFYVIRPRAGLAIMLLMVLLVLLLAAVSWGWAAQLPLPSVSELSALSLADYFFATLAFFLLPELYQRALERQLQDLHARQRELQARHAEMAQAVQMREHFLASVSHELRTPMNAILGLNSLLLEQVQDKPQALRVLQYTQQSADHLMTVINDVLDYSQFSSGQLRARAEVFELPVTVRAAFELFTPQVENRALGYSCEIDAAVPHWVRTDRHRLMQVLVNLLGNAIKFTHQGSVQLRLSVRDGGVEFSVSDTGIGMTPEQQASIFERFAQAHAQIQAQYGGNGLGLTISQRLVQLLGGTLQVHSQAGVGSRFVFWLPLQAVPAPAPAAQRPVVVAASPGTHRFLVVDDHPVNRLLVRQALLQHWPGCAVQESADGAQALQWLADGGRCDLVLMDMVMPVMDGIEATRRLREHPDWRHTPVLGLTANVNPQDLARFEAAGLDGLLLKPFELAQLRAQIERLLPGAATAAVPNA